MPFLRLEQASQPDYRPSLGLAVRPDQRVADLAVPMGVRHQIQPEWLEVEGLVSGSKPPAGRE